MTDSTVYQDSTGAKRKLRGIRLGQHIDTTMDASLIFPAMAKPNPPTVMERPSCLSTLWSCLTNPSPMVLASLVVLTVVLAVFAFSPVTNTAGQSATLQTSAQRYAGIVQAAPNAQEVRAPTDYRRPSGSGYRGSYDY